VDEYAEKQARDAYRKELFEKAVSFEKEQYKQIVERYGFPEVRLTDQIDPEEDGKPLAGQFFIENEKPIIEVSQWTKRQYLTLFHEFHHFLDWLKDPASLGAKHHFTERFCERNAIEDWNGFVDTLDRSDLKIPSGQIRVYINRVYRQS
jgi:hypothetical protein